MSQSTQTIPADQLAAMEPPALATWLIERARDARAMLLAEDYAGLKSLLNLLSAAAALATGPRRDLLEVAEAFIKPLGSKYLGGRDLALRRFLREHPEEAEPLLTTLLERGGLLKSVVAKFAEPLRAAIDELRVAGVLLDVDNRVVLAAGATGIVSELLQPPAFRLWAAVERARGEAQVRPAEAAQIVAAQTGVLVDEAARFLRAYPLVSKPLRRPPTQVSEVGTLDVVKQGALRPQNEGSLMVDQDATTDSQSTANVPASSLSRPRLAH